MRMGAEREQKGGRTIIRVLVHSLGMDEMGAEQLLRVEGQWAVQGSLRWRAGSGSGESGRAHRPLHLCLYAGVEKVCVVG
jgi:hypothetical protein